MLPLQIPSTLPSDVQTTIESGTVDIEESRHFLHVDTIFPDRCKAFFRHDFDNRLNL
jgi:hypothetical protein